MKYCSVDLRDGALGRHGETSKAYLVRQESFSIRTTIPEWVVDCLDIEPGDEIVWQIILNEDKQNAVLVHRSNQPEQ